MIHCGIKQLLKRWVLRLKWHGKLQLEQGCDIALQAQFEGMNKIYSHSSFGGILGYGSYIGHHSSLTAKIGRFCSISNHVICNAGIHPFQAPFATTSPCFFSLRKQNGATFATQQMLNEIKTTDNEGAFDCEIGNDVWICEGVFINGGIHIADGAVVLAHAVVTKDVPPYAIVGGVPAKIIGYRYDEATIKWLLNVQWWNNPIAWFRAHWSLLCDIDKLKAYYKGRMDDGIHSIKVILPAK